MGTYNRKISRKRYRLRLAQRRRDGEIARRLLTSHSQSAACAPVRAAACFDDFSNDFRNKVDALRGYALRSPREWRCRIKSKSEEKRFLDLLRFAFARYRVPTYLEQAWVASVDDDFIDKITAPNPADLPRQGAPDLVR